MLPSGDVNVEAPRLRARPSLHSYVRRASHGYIAPAKRTALIIGINHSQGAPPLPGSVRDAMNLHDALIGYGFREENITLLLDGQATKPAILAGLRSLAARTPSNGIAVFAAATHTGRWGGTNSFATAEGGRISAGVLAAHLGEVRAPAWVALPTCYAEGYALPGIVGFNRVATFASSADRESYQAGDAGSFLFIHMVRRGMLEGRAPTSVESAFGFAHSELSRRHPEYVPLMNDGYPGNLVLGPAPTIRTARWEPPAEPEQEPQTWDGWEYDTYGSDPYEDPSATPSPTPEPERRSGWSVCGSVSYNC
ncbi:MAG: caspase family protein [Actinomycetota bacterium]